MSNQKAFTLIELLVVVLIIGILAAVALPQYQKAVEKSRAAQALTLLKSLAQATEAYVLANGEMPTSFDELALSAPDWTGTTEWYSEGSFIKDTRSNKEWSLQLHAWGFYIGRIDGPYAGGGFGYYTKDNYNDLPKQQILCMERKSQGIIFNKPKGAYCQQILKGKFLGSYSTVNVYTLN